MLSSVLHAKYAHLVVMVMLCLSVPLMKIYATGFSSGKRKQTCEYLSTPGSLVSDSCADTGFLYRIKYDLTSLFNGSNT